MTDWSKHRGADDKVIDCVACKHSAAWRPYADPFRVCNQPDVLKTLGGQRSCRDIVRYPGGPCGPDGKRFTKREA